MDDDELPDGEMVDGEMVEIETDTGVEDTEDGGAIVTLDEDEDAVDDSEHLANLAETMPETELSSIASRFLELISRDKEARKKRDEQYEEGLRRTGMGDDAPGGADFQGASRVVHPLMTEACVDFAARAMKEIFPTGGPAKDYISGEQTPDKIDKAKRKTQLLNWQMTVQCPEVRAELEQLMTQVPLGGAQYMKIGWDERRNRPSFLFVPIDDMYLPYAATNFYTAQRKTHVQYLTQLDYEERVKSGMYRDVDLSPVGLEPEQSVAGVANDKIEGRDATSYNEDGLRIVFEVYVMADIDGDGVEPYILSIDKSAGKVLAIYRNWEEDDDTREEQQWFVEFPFIPWRGAYPIGLPHLIGGLSGAATGALRALLDAAHISNSQTMLKLKGGTAGGQSLTIQPGQVEEIEGGLNVDDVRKLAMPLPYNPPSPVLFSLLGFLVDAGKGVVRTSMEDIADNNPNAPVGTTLAKLEQGAVVYSSIHARMHDAMARMLRVLDRLNGLYLDDEQLVKEAGEMLARRSDFDGVLDVVPISDPNIFSEAQRYAQVQAVAQRAAALPQLYNIRKVEERLLETLKVPNAKDLLNPPVEPIEQNAVNENAAASLARPITAFPEQDHIAHLKTHLAYMMSPAFGLNPLIAPSYLPGMLNHIKEHIALWYVASTVRIASEAIGEDIGEAMRDIGKDNNARRALDQMLAEASTMVIEQGAMAFDALPPAIAQAQQLLQSLMPPPMQDPNGMIEGQKLQLQTQKMQQDAQMQQARLQIEQQNTQAAMQMSQARLQIEQQNAQADLQMSQAKLQIEQQNTQAGLQIDGAKLQLSAQELQARVQMEAQRQQAEDARKAAELQTRVAINADDNRTAMELAAAEIASGERVAVSTGTGINPNPGS